MGACPLAQKEAGTGEEAEHQRVSRGFCLSGEAVPTGRLPPAGGDGQSPPGKSCPGTEGPATSSKGFLRARVCAFRTTDLRQASTWAAHGECLRCSQCKPLGKLPHIDLQNYISYKTGEQRSGLPRLGCPQTRAPQPPARLHAGRAARRSRACPAVQVSVDAAVGSNRCRLCRGGKVHFCHEKFQTLTRGKLIR